MEIFVLKIVSLTIMLDVSSEALARRFVITGLNQLCVWRHAVKNSKTTNHFY